LSWSICRAGATQVLVASRDRWAPLVERLDSPDEPSLDELVARFDPAEIDLILVEGFAQELHPKIEVYRPAYGRAPVSWPADPSVVAVATDAPIESRVVLRPRGRSRTFALGRPHPSDTSAAQQPVTLPSFVTTPLMESAQ
jgi:molybdopterin-guanine dinucleotide biosynthesis protein B